MYGDIGTSPIYAMREAFSGPGAAPLTRDGVLGVASLVLWSLLIVVALKYLLVVMRADDHGEGGIIALEALATRGSTRKRTLVRGLTGLGLFGTALLYGDGMITPAISVLSAVEGLQVVTPSLEPLVLPAAVLILLGLFAVQARGTGRIGNVFGPVMLVWFAFLALTGLRQVILEPSVIEAANPLLGLRYLVSGGTGPLLSLGAVFLVVTGSEALYADMGHFGRHPISQTWFAVVFPSLILQYLGQSALLLRTPEVAEEVFYRMVPGWALLPALVLATLATVIASQALISGAFSLTAQAVQLGYLPRLRIQHTSDREVGQVYVPAVNWTLLAAALLLVVGFGSSARLASAYGVAVVLTMIITTVLFYVVARDHLSWPRWRAQLVCAGFLVVDLTFLAANVGKIPSGGWFPLLVGGVLLMVMATWIRGRELVNEHTRDGQLPLARFLRRIAESEPQRVPGTAVYLYPHPGLVPPALLANLERNHMLHDQVVIVSVKIERDAHIPRARRSEVEVLDHGFVSIGLRFGFADQPDVPGALAEIVAEGFGLVPSDTTWVVGADEIVATPGTGMALWRERLFVAMLRNSARASAHFALPANRVIQVGRRVDI